MRRHHQIIAVSIALSLAGFGCVSAPARTPATPSVPESATDQPTQATVAFGTDVTLAIGASATYGDGLTILLKAINDSRCPEGVQCIWQGELSPVLLVRGGSLANETELTLGTVRGLEQAIDGYVLALRDVTESSVILVVNRPVGPAGSRADKIRPSSPLADQVVSSPLTVTGDARGFWYFEASFPVKLLDAFGNELAVVPSQAQGEWMTEDFVPFRAELAFSTPATATGTLVLQKDNPSGLPEHADELRIPVRFSVPEGPQRTIRLYFYENAKDRDETGNLMCSKQGLAAVERQVPVTATPIQDAVRMLLQGSLTAEERTRGISTEFPLSGVELKGASLKDGSLTLQFADPENRTGGGSCRVGILWSQIEATAKQFPEVRSVRFIPEELFQP